jgi:hypothetical protein
VSCELPSWHAGLFGGEKQMIIVIQLHYFVDKKDHQVQKKLQITPA